MEAQQKDMFTKRWRQARELDPKESQIQIALIEHLKYRARPSVLYFHIPNGELRDKRAAAKLKAMGTLPGVADLVFMWPIPAIRSWQIQVLFLELKARSRKPAPEQLLFAERAYKAGAIYEFADNIDQALQILSRHDLLAR